MTEEYFIDPSIAHAIIERAKEIHHEKTPPQDSRIVQVGGGVTILVIGTHIPTRTNLSASDRCKEL